MLLTKRWRRMMARSNRANQRHINNIYFYLEVMTMKNENIPYKISLNDPRCQRHGIICVPI